MGDAAADTTRLMGYIRMQSTYGIVYFANQALWIAHPFVIPPHSPDVPNERVNSVDRTEN